MGTSVQVAPLSRAYGESPLCYLLAVDGFRFLLDCGWTDLCDTSQLQPLGKYGILGAWTVEATEHLKMHCTKNLDLHVYHAPQIEEAIDVTSDLCAYKVQPSEKLMSNIISKKLGELEIAWVDAKVGKEDEKLILLPSSSTLPPHKPVLETGGVLQVEFAGGALRCGKYVIVCKIGDSSQKRPNKALYICDAMTLLQSSTGRGLSRLSSKGPCARTIIGTRQREAGSCFGL